MEGDGKDASMDVAMNFLAESDCNRFTSLLDELTNDLEKGKITIQIVVDAMQLAQSY